MLMQQNVSDGNVAKELEAVAWAPFFFFFFWQTIGGIIDAE